MKNTTAWSKQSQKSATPWAGATKSPAAWASNVAKSQTAYTQSTQQNTGWNKTAPVSQAVRYNDLRFSYSDLLLNYNSRPNLNTDNQRLQAVWSAT